MVGVLRHCAGHFRLRGRPWQRSSRAPEYSKRIPHRPADRPVGDDRVCPDDKLAAPAHGTALGHRRAEADVHSRVLDLPRIRAAVHGRGRRRHADRVAGADGARRFNDAGDGNGNSPLCLRRERTRQGARPSDQRCRFGSGRRTGHRRFRRRRFRMARRIPADHNPRSDCHRRGTGRPQPKEDGRRAIRGTIRSRRSCDLHGSTGRVPACDEQRGRDGLARSTDRRGLRGGRWACRFLHVLGVAKPESDARRVAVSVSGVHHRSRCKLDLVHEHLIGAVPDALLPSIRARLLAGASRSGAGAGSICHDNHGSTRRQALRQVRLDCLQCRRTAVYRDRLVHSLEGD